MHCIKKSILSREFNSHGQVDLVDMQSNQQGQFKWIMVYQCHLTKFVIFRALSSKRAAEVAYSSSFVHQPFCKVITGLQVHVPPPSIMEQPSLSPLDKRLQEITSQRKRALQCQLSPVIYQ